MSVTYDFAAATPGAIDAAFWSLALTTGGAAGAVTIDTPAGSVQGVRSSNAAFQYDVGIYTAIAFNQAQSSKCKIRLAGSFVGCAILYSFTGGQWVGYDLICSATGATLYKRTASSTHSSIASATSLTIVDDDEIELGWTNPGGIGTITVKQNGSTILTYDNGGAGESTYTSGSPGFAVRAFNKPQVVGVWTGTGEVSAAVYAPPLLDPLMSYLALLGR